MKVTKSLNVNADIYEVLDRLFMESSPYFEQGYKEASDYLMVQCPYHKMGKENRPSAQFRKEDGLFYCFSAETPIITDKGIKNIGELVNTEVNVLNGNGNWETVTIQDCGVQKLYEISLKREQNEKIIYATGDHIWFDKTGKEYTTLELRPYMYLKTQLNNFEDFTVDDEGVRHGMIYGDGWKKVIYKTYGTGKNRTVDKNRVTGVSYVLSFYKNSNKHHLQKWFSNSDQWIIKTYKHGETRIRSKRFDVDPAYKDLPDITKGRDYLLSFLMGYIATDGNKAYSITTYKEDAVNTLVDIMITCGITVKQISSRVRPIGTTYVDREVTAYTIHYFPHNLPEKFFINDYKQCRQVNYGRLCWKVQSVKETTRIERVYCCATSTQSFVLAGNILTHNCHNCKCSHPLPSVIGYVLDTNGVAWLRDNFEVNSETVYDASKFKLKRKEKKEKPVYINPEALKKYEGYSDYMLNTRKIAKWVLEFFDIGYDKENKCVTFPVKNQYGDILFVATRSTEKKFFHYPEGVEKPIYGLYEIYKARQMGMKVDKVFVVESMIDALSIWSWGGFAIAMNGTGSHKQYAQLNASDIKYFVLATDNDSAGKQARKKFRDNVKHKIIRELDYDGYELCKDINDMTEEQFWSIPIVKEWKPSVKPAVNKKPLTFKLLDTDTPLQQELVKALNIMDPHWEKQENAKDYNTKFIYEAKSVEEVSTYCKEHGLDLNYALHRWFNAQVSFMCEDLFVKHGAVDEENTKDKLVDFYLKGEPFDLKVTAFPDGETFNMKTRKGRDQLIEWFYKNQSQGGRKHFGNRLFIVCDGSSTKNKLYMKTRFDIIEQRIKNYMKYLDTHPFNTVTLMDGDDFYPSIKSDIIYISEELLNKE